MGDLRAPPAEELNAGRYFNLAVAGLVFCLVLAFAAWVILGALTQRPVELLRAFAGTVMGIAAMLLLLGVHAGWRSTQPFQHDRRFVLGMALLGIGVTILVVGLR